MTRPVLPSRHANPHLKQSMTHSSCPLIHPLTYLYHAVNDGPLPPVKYQILNCQGKDILVGVFRSMQFIFSTCTPGRQNEDIDPDSTFYSRLLALIS